MKRILYYAFGGGLGHVVRTVSLARQLARHGGQHLIAFNSPFTELVRRIETVETSLRFASIPSTFNSDHARQAFSEIHAAFEPDVLVVDTFPRGLGGDLVDLLTREQHDFRLLISRTLPAKYVDSQRLLPFVESFYDLVIAPGELFGVAPVVPLAKTTDQAEFLSVNPFLIRDASELPSRLKAAQWLHSDPARPVTLLAGSGNEAECQEMVELFLQLTRIIDFGKTQIRLALPVALPLALAAELDKVAKLSKQDLLVKHWPLMECLPGVDWVVGSAGYNLFWETESLRIDRLLVARRRRYDNQVQRVQNSSRFSIAEIVNRISVICKSDPCFDFANGANQAASEIVQRAP